MKSLYLNGLYGITDPLLMPNDDQLINYVNQAIKGGMKILQYRNKLSSLSTVYRQARLLRNLCTQHNILFIINDNVNLANDVKADGIHLGQQDLTLKEARKLNNKIIIGISCENSLNLAQKAQNEGADYVAFGRFFPSKTKPDAPLTSIDILIKAKNKLNLPIVAIGGITLQNCKSVINAGADMIAVINALFATRNITNQAKSFNQCFEE